MGPWLPYQEDKDLSTSKPERPPECLSPEQEAERARHKCARGIMKLLGGPDTMEEALKMVDALVIPPRQQHRTEFFTWETRGSAVVDPRIVVTQDAVNRARAADGTDGPITITDHQEGS
jgi:hypothetical protein